MKKLSFFSEPKLYFFVQYNMVNANFRSAHALVVLLAMGLVLNLGSGLFASERFSALVILVQGQASIESDGKIRPLKKDMLVSEGDWILTKTGGRVGLQLSRGTSIYIGPKTKVQIHTLEKKKEGRKIRMGLQKGSLMSRAGKEPGKLDMEVKAPTLIAAVRGTEFAVDADAKENSVSVNEGEVVVLSETGKVKETTLRAGEKIIATQDGLKKAILAKHEKERFRLLKQMESMKKAQFEAYTEQIRRNEALREHMQKNILQPK